MGKSLALVSTIRMGSTRLPEKMAMEFCDGSTLSSRLAQRMADARNRFEFSNVGIAVHPGEIELVNIVLGSSIPSILRSDKSASSDKLSDIFDFIKAIDASHIMWVNGGNVFLDGKTIAEAAETFMAEDWDSMTAVRKRRNWFWNMYQYPLDYPSSGKTQDAALTYEATHSFHIFSKDYMLNEGKYWSGERFDPAIFMIPGNEWVDVDTKEDFDYADYLIGAKL